MRLRTIALALVLAFLASCNKNHYDFDHLEGVALQGQVCVPIASAQYTVGDMIERFQLDTLLVFGEEGDMSLAFDYEVNDVVRGCDLLHFDEVNEHFEYTFENEHPFGLVEPIDTVVHYVHELYLESDYAHLNWAVLKRGLLEFVIETNVTQLHHLDLTIPQIFDAAGEVLHLSYDPHMNVNQMDLTGFHYSSDDENVLQLVFDVDFTMHDVTEPFYNVSADFRISDLAVSEMRGRMGTYTSRSWIDTTFSLLPGNLSGEAALIDAHVAVQERNGFGLSARFVVDTALMGGNALFSEMPLTVEVPASSTYVDAFDALLDGRIDLQGGEAYSSALFVLNPEGYDGVVSVSDTSSIDLKIGVDIPFAFSAMNVSYRDTLDMDLGAIEYPELVDCLDLDLVFASGLPMTVLARAYAYDSQTGLVTDALLDEGAIISGSYDGFPQTTTVEVRLTSGRIENLMRADKLILVVDLDSNSHDVVLKLSQQLGLTVRARIQYEGVVELPNKE